MHDRPTIDLGDDPQDTIDLSELAKAGGERPSADRAAAKRVATEAGFVSRGDRTRRRRARRSPYTVTYGIRTRETSREIFQDIAEHLELSDAQTFELAIQTLAEAYGTPEHAERIEAIVGPKSG